MIRFDPRLHLVSTLPAALRAQKSSEAPIHTDVIVQIVVRDVDRLDVYYHFHDRELEVVPGISNAVDLTLCVYSSDLEALAGGKLDVQRAARRGHLIALGDPAVLEWLATWPPLGALRELPVSSNLWRAKRPEPPIMRDARKAAYLELYQLMNDPVRDGEFRSWVEHVLRNELGVKRAQLEQWEAPADIPIRKANERRQRALLVLLVDPHLSSEIRAQVVERLGRYGDEAAIPAVDALIKRRATPPVVKAAKKALSSIRRGSKLNVVFAAMEAKPYCGTGGLGNVMAELPRALAKMGHQVAVIVPRHEIIDPTHLVDTQKHGMVFGPEGTELFGLRTHERDGVSYYFIENDRYFSKGRSGIYVDENGAYPDNAERYDFFCAAIPQAIRLMLGKKSPDIIQLNDAHCGPAAAYIRRDPAFDETKTVLAVHNLGLAYQARFDPEHLPRLRFTGLGLFHPDGPAELEERINFLKIGLLESDAAITVSRTYMREILDEHFGEGLHGINRVLFARDRLWGNLNGIDPAVWNPETDPLVEHPFSAHDQAGKKASKASLQRRFGLPVDPEVPLIAVVARLTEQKGFDDVIGAIRELNEGGRRVQFLVVGQGDPAIAEWLRKLEKKYPHNMRFDGDFTVEKEHRIYAGADFFLMPSKFEPSGLPQMYALRYLTIPIVRAVGGLDESIEHWNAKKKTGNGFKFDRELVPCIECALDWFEQGEKARQPLIKNAGRSDFSWETTSAVEQVAFYRKILG